MKIPDYERQVSSPGGANIRMNPNAPEAAFGVAVDSGAAIGKGMRELGAVINEIAVKRQEDIDRAAVTAAVSDYMKRSTSLMYDSEKGFLNAIGKGAEGLHERAGEAYKSMEMEVRKTLKNKNQAGLFDRMIVSPRQQANQTIMMHEVKALAEWRKEEGNNLSVNTSLAVSKNILDPAGFETLHNAAAINAMNKYGDQGAEQNATNTQKELSSMIILTAGYAATDGRYDEAEKFLTLNKEELGQAVYEKSMEEIKKQALPSRAQDLAIKLFTENGIDNLAAAREYVRENFQGKEEDAYMSALEGLYSDRRQERSDARDSVADSITGMIYGGAGYNKTMAQLKANRALLGERGYYGLKDQLDKRYYVGDYADKRPETRQQIEDRVMLLSEIRAKMRTGEIATVTELSEQYGAHLSNKDFQTLGFEIGKGKTEKDPYNKSNPMSIVGSIAKDAGVTADPREEVDFWDSFQSNVLSFEQEKGRKATPKELVDLGAELVKDKVVKKDYNSVEKGLMNIGVPDRFFTPDSITTAKTYQIDVAGAIYDPELGIYWVRDEKGERKGWLPDNTPKPLPKKKQKYPDVNNAKTTIKSDSKAEAQELLDNLALNMPEI